MRLGDTGLDDLLNESLYVLDQDGRRLARFLRWLFVLAYRGLNGAMLLSLSLPWAAREALRRHGKNRAVDPRSTLALRLRIFAGTTGFGGHVEGTTRDSRRLDMSQSTFCRKNLNANGGRGESDLS
jgi:hypothetical protein